MPRKSKEEFLKTWTRRRGASPAPSHTDHPRDYLQLSDEELKAEIEKRAREVREARERELAAYASVEASLEPKTNLYTELRKRGIKPRGGHWIR